MASTWGKKLEKKLTDLADSASKESIQTLANWIAFNRKHASTIATILINALLESKNNSKRQWLFWQLIHEVLVMERESKKWGKFSELRVLLGEALQPAMENLGSTIPENLNDCLQEWEDHDVFEGPSRMSQIRRLYQNKNIQTDKTTSPVSKEDNPSSIIVNEITTKPKDTPSNSVILQSSEEKVESSASALVTTITTTPITVEDIKDKVNHEDQTINQIVVSTTPSSSDDVQNQKQQETNENQALSTKSPSPQKRNSFSNLNQIVEYDFESKGVTPGAVESREFLDPCKAITTLQIARDVRTNTTVEISTALANLSPDIMEACQDLKSGKLKELDTPMTNDFSIRIPSILLDVDVNEETSNLNMFQDIVQRQKKAREKLIYLLLKSRCQFGSMEAAREFYEMDNVAGNLKKRKEMLSDALELEGLDTSQIIDDSITETSNKNSQNKKKDEQQELVPLVWYKPDIDDDKSEEIVVGKKESTEKKKQRTA